MELARQHRVARSRAYALEEDVRSEGQAAHVDHVAVGIEHVDDLQVQCLIAFALALEVQHAQGLCQQLIAAHLLQDIAAADGTVAAIAPRQEGL